MNFEAIIHDLKLHLGADSDIELAQALGLHRTTICQWRRRGSVPKEYRIPANLRRVVYIDDIVFYELLNASEAWRRACELAGSNRIPSEHLREVLPALDAAIERECDLNARRTGLRDTRALAHLRSMAL